MLHNAPPHWLTTLGPTLVSFACSGVLVTLLKFRLDRLSREQTRQLDEMKALERRGEERDYSLRMQRVQPFFEKVHESLKQSDKLNINVDAVRKLPYPDTALKTLLFSTGEPQTLADLREEVSNLRASILLGMDAQTLATFSVQVNDFIKFQLQMFNILALNPLSDSVVAEFQKKRPEHYKSGIGILNSLRSYLRRPAPSVDDQDFTVESLQGWLSEGVSAQPKVGAPQQNPSWLALWSMQKDDPVFDMGFDEEFARFREALSEKIMGILDLTVSPKFEKGGQQLGYMIVAYFSGKERLDTFLTLLPSIKEQSKILWKEPLTPEERRSS